MHGNFKPRFNFTHRRMKTTLESFQKNENKNYHLSTLKHQELLEKAKIAYKNENFMETVIKLEEYFEFKSFDNQALYLCAVSYLSINQPHQAIQKLQKITNSYPNKEQSLLLLAVAYAKVDNFQKSLQIINECLDKYPRFEEGYSYRGKLYLRFEKYDRAERDFYYSLKLNPKSFISRVGLGDCFYQQRKCELALKCYDQSLQCIDKKFIQNISDIQKKKGVCYFQLGKWKSTIQSFERLSNKQLNTESYFYLGVSYLKLNRKQQGILNLEYCIKLQSKQTAALVQKAFKILIQLYLNDFQFYEAINILKLMQSLKADLSCKFWCDFVEGCMLIIKSYYQDGVNKLNSIYDLIKKKKNFNFQSQVKDSNADNQFLFLTKKDQQSKEDRKSGYNPRGRKSFSLKYVRKASFHDDQRNKTLFKSIQDKSLGKQIIRQTSSTDNRIRKFFKNIKKPQVKTVIKDVLNEQEILFMMPILLKFKGYGQFYMNNYLRSLDTYEEYENYMRNNFGKQNSEIVFNKIICEVFLLHKSQLYREALEKIDSSIEEHQKQHNFLPVEPLLYKISTYLKLSIPYFFVVKSQNSVAMQSQPIDKQQQKGYEYLEQVLDIHSAYSQNLKNHHLSHYYLSIMYYLCEKYDDAQNQLQNTIKIVQQCNWKILFLKGVVEIHLNNTYDAIKQFTAGIILDQSPDLYLGRSISFLLEGTKRKIIEQKSLFNLKKKSLKQNKQNLTQNQLNQQKQSNSQLFIEKSFQDLQKFIQLQSNQDKISLWVTKLLFFNQSYDQANRALKKIDQKCNQLQELNFWLKFYQGQFQQCGNIGNLIINAFEGQILTKQQQEKFIMSAYNKSNIIQILKLSKLNPSYSKWIIILHLFKRQLYSSLIKLLQKFIFDAQNIFEEIQLKYNLAVAYFMIQQKNKAFGVLQTIITQFDYNEKLNLKIRKILNGKLDEDQCLQDLSEELCVNGNHRLSEFLPYKSIDINHKTLKRIYLKPSIPFPQFPKPIIQLKASKQFFDNELQLQNIQKRIDAPWIKKNKQKIQFTDQIIDADTDFLKQTKNLNQQSIVLSTFKQNQI